MKGDSISKGILRLGDQILDTAMAVRVAKGAHEGHQRGKEDWDSSQGVLGEQWTY